MESKKVAAVICGGIGNQLYIISALLTFAKKYNYKPIFDEGFIENLHTKDTIFELYPNIWNYITKDKLYNYKEYTEIESTYDEIKPISNSILLRGYFQHHLYFDHDYIKNIFADWLKGEPHDNIVIHVRRGDYLKHNNVFNILTKEYFLKALEYFPEKDIIIISEDLEWCKRNINSWNINGNRKIIYQNLSIKEDLETIVNTTQGVIISNSTFSWWGAFLNSNNPRVIFPKEWFASSFSNKKDNQYYIERWISFSVDEFKMNVQDDMRIKSNHLGGYEYSKKYEKDLFLTDSDKLNYYNNMLIFTWYLSKMDECKEYAINIYELWKNSQLYINKTIRQNIKFPLSDKLDIKINLTRVPCIIISLPTHINERNKIVDVLQKYQINPIFSDGITTLPTIVMNIGQAHINAIKLGLSLNDIFLIFEEDFVLTDEFKLNFVLPPMTDGFFLGHSRSGLNNYCINGNYNGNNNIIYEEDIMGYYRIKNMLALHGVLYCNKNYCNKVISLLELSKKTNVPCDVGTAHSQEYSNVLTCNEPWCYQKDRIDKPFMERGTNVKLSEIAMI